MKERLRQRLAKALKVLAQLERKYNGDTSYYQDQLDYIAALKEHIGAEIDHPLND